MKLSLGIIFACSISTACTNEHSSKISSQSRNIQPFFNIEEDIRFQNNREVINNQKFDVSDVSFLWPNNVSYDKNKSKDDQDYLLRVKDLFAANDPILAEILKLESFFSFDDSMDPNRLAVRNPYTGFMEKSSNRTDTFKDILNYKVVSVRFDDCAPRSHDQLLGVNKTKGSFFQYTEQNAGVPSASFKAPPVKHQSDISVQCIPQMRLVVMPLFTDGEPIVGSSNGKSDDAGIHLIYSFIENPATFYVQSAHDRKGDFKILKNMIQDLQVLKYLSPKTNGLPLGSHPGLAINAEKSIHKELKSIIKHYAQPIYLNKVAFLMTDVFNARGKDWVFSAVQVHQSQSQPILKFIPIFNSILDENSISNSYPEIEDESIFNRLNIEGAITQHLTIDFPVQSKFSRKEIPALPMQLGQGLNRDNIAKILNPNKQDIDNTDCISCHVATNAFYQEWDTDRTNLSQFADNVSGLKGGNLLALLKSKFYYRPYKGITAFVDPNYLQDPNSIDNLKYPVGQTHANFHSFSLGKSDFGSISMRVVYESAEVAASINRRLFGSPDGLGQVCTEKQFVEKTAELIKLKYETYKVTDDQNTTAPKIDTVKKCGE